MAIYWWYRIKITILHAIYEWSERKSCEAEDRMIELANRYDW